MRTTLFVLLSILAACGNDGATDGDDSPDASIPGGGISLDPPARGFQVVSPDVMIMPGQEITYCYYFHTPNTETMVIKKWVSAMTPGSHHMIMYASNTDEMPPGTISTDTCGGFAGSNAPRWTYSAQTPTNELALPSNDGTGLPLGQEIAAGTPAYFQMHYLNATDAPIHAHVVLNAEAYEAGVPYTKTEAYVTYNGNINIPPHAVGDLESMTCNVPANIKFWLLSTHAHQQAVQTTVKDGPSTSTATVFSSTDWEHPGAMMWSASPFYTFATNKLTYECTYNNTGPNAAKTVTSGPSAVKNEMCMATGYYFPATKPLLCLNNLGPF
jgi:Copper type II ascorbate-dependent monooxygenase, C-terminal domain